MRPCFNYPSTEAEAKASAPSHKQCKGKRKPAYRCTPSPSKGPAASSSSEGCSTAALAAGTRQRGKEGSRGSSHRGGRPSGQRPTPVCRGNSNSGGLNACRVERGKEGSR